MKSLAAIFLILNAFSASAKQAITIYTDDGGMPLSYAENGTAKGVYVDIVAEAAKLMPDYDIKIEPIPWRRGLARLERGQILALLPPYKIQSRAYITPYSTPILEEEVVLFCRDDVIKNLPQPVSFPASVRDLKIGVNDGNALSEGFSNAIKNKLIKVDYAKETESNIFKLLLKRTDCYAGNEYNFYWAINNIKSNEKRQQLKQFQFSKVLTISKETGFLGYSKSFNASYKNDFIEKMDAALVRLKETGVIRTLSQKYRER